MDAMLKAELENAQQSLLETYELAMLYGNNAQKDSKVYLDLMEQLCQIKGSSMHSERALKVAKNQLTVDDFNEAYNTELAKDKEFNAKKSDDYKTFQNHLSELAVGAKSDDNVPGPSTGRLVSDEFVMESEINIFDPLTKKRMQDPVRNIICGHHYEKSTIFEAISINRRLRCPVAGCGNNRHVEKQHLTQDNEMRMRLLALTDDSQDPLD